MSDAATPSLHPNVISSGYLTYSIVTGVLLLLAAICVLLRFVYRFRNRDFGWDDWTILGALITDLGMFICNVLISLPSLGGAGYHIGTYSPGQLQLWAKVSITPLIKLTQAYLASSLVVANYYMVLDWPRCRGSL